MSRDATSKISRTQIEKDLRVQRMKENIARKIASAGPAWTLGTSPIGTGLFEALVEAEEPNALLAALGALLAARAGYVVMLPPEPTPKDTGGPSVWEEVIDDLVEATREKVLRDDSMVDLVAVDMKDRDIVGRERYGRPLQAGNGRDALRDAYEEALDHAVYRRQAFDEAVSPEARGYTPLRALATVADEQLTPYNVDGAVRARAYWKAVEAVLATREEIERREDAKGRRTR